MPLNCIILRALAGGTMQQAELRRETGSPAPTTLRAQLKRLVEIGVIEKHRRNRFPGVLEYELTAAGRDLLFVVDILERWLAQAPTGPLQFGGNAAKSTIKSFVEGWSSTMLRALASSSLSLTELDAVIDSLNYPSLQRRLGAMRLAGLVEPGPGRGRGTPYAVTDWLRRGVGPIAAAARWERRHRPRTTAPIGALDVESAFLLTVALVEPPPEVSGSCRLAVEMPSGKGRRLAGVTVGVQGGRVASCATELRGHPDAWALGSAVAWLDAVIEPDGSGLEQGGDCSLAHSLVAGLHGALFEAGSAIHP
jgi:DNA-binding HxlR family transcriptional regulator